MPTKRVKAHRCSQSYLNDLLSRKDKAKRRPNTDCKFTLLRYVRD